MSAIEYSLMRMSRPAMATRFEIDLPSGTPDSLAAAEAALDLIATIEEQISVYREHSIINQLNTRAFRETITIPSDLTDLLMLCARLTNDTLGAFDVGTGRLIKAWGFYHRAGRVPSPQEHAEAMQASGIRHVILHQNTVRFRRSLELNLGSIGKGYALDRAGDLLRTQWGVRSALLHAGGSSVLAIGAPPGESGWPVAIRHPQVNRTIATVRLRDEALATSAATYQCFEYNGKKYGHVLDPRSGWPASGVASASAVSATAAEADAWATAYFVLGMMPAGSGLILHESGRREAVNLDFIDESA